MAGRDALSGNATRLLSKATVLAVIVVLGALASHAAQIPQFTTPVPVTELNSGATDREPWISPDGLEAYFASNRNGTDHIYHSTRASLDAPFGTPVWLSEVNASPRQVCPSVSSDGLTMYFARDESAIWVITRTAETAPWDSATQHIVPGVNSSGVNASPQISLDGLTLYFHHVVVPYNVDLCYSSRSSTSEDFGPPTFFTELNTGASEAHPYVTSDGLMIFFSYSPDGIVAPDIHVAVRDSTSQPFGAPVSLASVNSTAWEWRPFYHEATKTLYFTSSRLDGVGDIFRCQLVEGNVPEIPQFTSPVLVTELNSSGNTWTPWISNDGLEIYLASDRDDAATMHHIYRSARSSLSEPFGTPVRVMEINHPPRQFDPWLSDDGLTMYFTSSRPQGLTDRSIWEVRRTSIQALWDSATQRLLPNVNTPDVLEWNEGAQVTSAGLAMYFSRAAVGAAAFNFDLYRATRLSTSEEFGTPEPLAELNSAAIDSWPFITRDGLMIFFASARAGSNQGSIPNAPDLYVTVRGSTAQPFETPVNLSNLNTAMYECRPIYHEQTQTLYFCSDRNGRMEVYSSRRVTGPPGGAPNLTVSQADFAPAAPTQLRPGDAVTLGAFVENTSATAAGTFWTEVWGSRTGGLTLDRFLADSLYLPAGLPGSGAYSWVTTAPLYSIPDGPYTVVYTVDRPGQVAESNERDNRAAVRAKRILVIRPQSQTDLAVENFAMSPNPAASGGAVSFAGRVVNRGSERSGPFWIEFWGSWDWPYPNLNFFLCDSIYIANLDPGAAVELSAYPRQLYNVPTGVFQVGCFADRDDAINELDETNNYQFVDGQVFNSATLIERRRESKLLGADIAIVSADVSPVAPAQLAPGDTITLTTDLANRGTGDTGPFWLEYWGSRDGGVTLSDFLTVSDRIANLAPGATVRLTSAKSLTGVPDGPYSVVVFADRLRDVSDTNEVNNRRVIAGKRLLVIRLPTGANLVIQQFVVGTGIRSILQLHGTVSNEGTADSGPFWVEFWACPGDPDYPWLDRFLCDSIPVDNLAPGDSLSLAGYWLAPYHSVTAGQYAVIAFVDRLDQVIETDETDNYQIVRNVAIPPH